MMKTSFTLVISISLGGWVLAGAFDASVLARGAAAQQRPAGAAARRNPCEQPANKIVAENCKPGSPSTEWDINGAGDPTIQGFATDISANLGETVSFKIKTDSPAYRIDIYRMGYYGGMGARKVATVKPSAQLPQRQPACLVDYTVRLYDCGNWAVSGSWTVPADAVSGIYFARLVREDGKTATWRVDNSLAGPAQRPPAEPHAYGAQGLGKLANPIDEPRASHIYFIVRDDAGKSDILFQTSDQSWVAYNSYTDRNIQTNTYNSSLADGPVGRRYDIRAHKVSYNRPFSNRAGNPVDQPFNAEYPMVRWLEANGYNVSYFASHDTTRRGELLKQHKVFITAGHDEYWSGEQRRHVEAARDGGVHLAFFAGNDVFWKIRFEPSIDPSKTPHRTLVVYKENHDRAKIDPEAKIWTGTWRTSSAYNPEGPNPENGLTGTIFTVNAWRNDPLVVPSAFSRLRFWRNTDVAKLKPGDSAVMVRGILGHEWNEDLDNGFRPAGLIRMSETVVDNVVYIQDFGTVYDSGTATHHLTLYRAKSGALVFSAGTVQWSWGLDPNHDNPNGVPAQRANSYNTRVGVDPRGANRSIQQATVNLFADMGVQPATLQADLVPATASTDKMPPVSRVTAPAPGAPLTGVVRITGTARDTGGGVVAGVEVSVDGGNRWHPANGREEWSYEWRVPQGVTAAKILSRATDDSANTERPR